MPGNIISKHAACTPKMQSAQAAAFNVLPLPAMDAACRRINQWQGYAPTPLYSLSACAEQYGMSNIYYKDEAPRFGLESFKALGGAYAIECLLEKHIADGGQAADFTVATATDGNHGRSVAWGAQRAGCAAKIYVHRHVSEERISAITSYGAEVIRINGNYDDSVYACSEQAQQYGWHIVSDTSWAGYLETPRLVMAGYTLSMREAIDQLNQKRPTHIILQAGVGAFAAAMIAAFIQYNNYLPRIIVVESEYADCLLRSAAAGRITQLSIEQETIMAGLSCGEPSLLAWEILSAAVTDFVAITDTCIGEMMRQLAHNDIVGGECAGAGLAVLAAAAQDAYWRQTLELTADSSVLLFGSEGATDKNNYRRLTGLDSAVSA